MIDNFDDFDSDIPVNYRGFDLSDIDYNELPGPHGKNRPHP